MGRCDARGAGEGRIHPYCLGLWGDRQNTSERDRYFSVSSQTDRELWRNPLSEGEVSISPQTARETSCDDYLALNLNGLHACMQASMPPGNGTTQHTHDLLIAVFRLLDGNIRVFAFYFGNMWLNTGTRSRAVNCMVFVHFQSSRAEA